MSAPESYFSDLLGIAEISTVFIGFAALLSVLSPEQRRGSLLMGIVIGAAAVVVGCLIPLLLNTTGMAVDSNLRTSAALFVVLNVSVTLPMFRAGSQLADQFRNTPGLASVIWGLEALMYLFFLSCVLGFWMDYIATLYLAGLITLLLQMITMFVRMVIQFNYESN